MAPPRRDILTLPNNPFWYQTKIIRFCVAFKNQQTILWWCNLFVLFYAKLARLFSREMENNQLPLIEKKTSTSTRLFLLSIHKHTVICFQIFLKGFYKAFQPPHSQYIDILSTVVKPPEILNVVLDNFVFNSDTRFQNKNKNNLLGVDLA